MKKLLVSLLAALTLAGVLAGSAQAGTIDTGWPCSPIGAQVNLGGGALLFCVHKADGSNTWFRYTP